MTLNRYWILKEPERPGPSDKIEAICPYFKTISGLASYAKDGQCMAWAGGISRFCTASDIFFYCKKDYPQCPYYQAVVGESSDEPLQDDAWAWPSL